MPEAIVEKLASGGVGTIEKLGSMTPEELEELPGVGPQMVEKIFAAVNSYYGQFEEPQAVAPVDEEAEERVVPTDGEIAAEEAAAAEQGADKEEVMDAAFAHLSVAPSQLGTSPNPDSSIGEGEFDTIKDSESAG